MSLYDTLKDAQIHLREMLGFPVTLREKPEPPKQEQPKEQK